MNQKRRARLMAALFLLAGAGATVGLTLMALSENINMFYPPAEVVSGAAPLDRQIRAGGMVEDGSVARAPDTLAVSFVLTDHAGARFTVHYEGILPDLFREGQGVVTEGTLGPDGLFTAREVLAKHDENYMPKEVADALKESGQWRHGSAEDSSQ